MLKGYRGFMTRNISLLLVCTAIFLSLMLVTASADGEGLLGLDVYVVGNHAYVAGGVGGLYVVNIRRPANPKRVASVDTPGEALGLYPLYNLLIVADGSRGLQLIDIRVPKSLSIVATYDTPGETRNVYGLASTVYVAGSGFGLGVFDVIDRSRLDPNGHFLVNPDR
jgi:hypothetical protein